MLSPWARIWLVLLRRGDIWRDEELILSTFVERGCLRRSSSGAIPWRDVYDRTLLRRHQATMKFIATLCCGLEELSTTRRRAGYPNATANAGYHPWLVFND